MTPGSGRWRDDGEVVGVGVASLVEAAVLIEEGELTDHAGIGEWAGNCLKLERWNSEIGMHPADYRSRRRCRLLNILAVEDETAVAQLLALVLGGPNCKVATASNAEKALAKIDAAKRPFDVVITDHRMPRVSGLELVRELRARKFGGKVVVLSAHLAEDNIKAYQQLGVNMLISKPFDVDELRKTIDVLANEAA
jgi:CheY-like chemotaxis protein